MYNRSKKIAGLEKNCEIIFVCDGDAARLAESEGFCVIKLPLNGAFREKYLYGSKTDFEPFIDPLLDAIVKTINPDMVIMNFRYSFEECIRNKIPFVLLFPNELDDRLKFYSELANKIFFTYPTFYKNKNLTKVDVVGPIIPERKACDIYMGKNTFLLTLGGGGWKDQLKEIIEKFVLFFDSQEELNLLVLTDHFNEKDFLIKNNNIRFHKFVNSSEEFIDLIIRSKGVITHGGTTLIQAAYYKKPVISVPLPFLRDQIKRTTLFSKAGCVVQLDKNNLNNESILKAIRLSLDRKILKKQKKILTDFNASDKIANYIIEKAKKKNIIINTEGFKDTYCSNNETDLCLLENKKSRIFLSWTSNTALDYQNPVPEWFRKIVPYYIQKELKLHRRNSHEFMSCSSLETYTSNVNNHHTRMYSLDKISIARWHCKESGKSFICLTDKEDVVSACRRIKCH